VKWKLPRDSSGDHSFLMWTFCVEGLRIAIESGQVAFPASDLLFNSAIIVTPEKLNVATKTIGGCLARAVRLYEQKPGKACFAPSRLKNSVQEWIK
jgi:hypothetical protein